MSDTKILRAPAAIALLVLMMAVASIPSFARATGPQSSPEDRRRFVAVVHILEQAPLAGSARDERAWALAWLTDAPDVTVHACLEPLNGLAKTKYAYAPELVVQDMLSMGAFAIEHADAAKDEAAVQLAGIEGTLAAYRAILKGKPAAHAAPLDALIELQAKGELAGFARDAWARCSAKEATPVA